MIEPFALDESDPLLQRRFFVPPILLNYSWQDKIELTFSLDQSGVFTLVVLEMEKRGKQYRFCYSSSLQCEQQSIKFSRDLVYLPKKFKKLDPNQTSKNFVLGFFNENGDLLRLSLPFHARTKWVTQRSRNLEALLDRLGKLDRKVHNIELVKLLEETKKLKYNSSILSKCTWLQKKLINDEREITLDEVVERVRTCYLKTGNASHKTFEAIQFLLEKIRKSVETDKKAIPQNDNKLEKSKQSECIESKLSECIESKLPDQIPVYDFGNLEEWLIEPLSEPCQLSEGFDCGDDFSQLWWNCEANVARKKMKIRAPDLHEADIKFEMLHKNDYFFK